MLENGMSVNHRGLTRRETENVEPRTVHEDLTFVVRLSVRTKNPCPVHEMGAEQVAASWLESLVPPDEIDIGDVFPIDELEATDLTKRELAKLQRIIGENHVST